MVKETVVRLSTIAGSLLLLLVLFESEGLAQQQFLHGNCLYQSGSNQLVGCYGAGSGGRLWFVAANRTFLDVKSGLWFGNHPNGTLMVWTTQGWYPAQAHTQAIQVSNEIAAANRQALQRGATVQVGPGVTGTPQQGGGMTLTITPQFSVSEIVQSQLDPRTAQALRQSEQAGATVWNQRPPGPWYGR
jgi:hypothetical protein